MTPQEGLMSDPAKLRGWERQLLALLSVVQETEPAGSVLEAAVRVAWATAYRARYDADLTGYDRAPLGPVVTPKEER